MYLKTTPPRGTDGRKLQIWVYKRTFTISSYGMSFEVH